MKKVLLALFLLGFSVILTAEERITLSGVAVSNFKVINAKRQIIILYKNNVPAYVCITDIPFTVFENVECLPSDELRAEVIAVDAHFAKGRHNRQYSAANVRETKTVKASARNEHGFVTLQPKFRRDMDKVYAK